MKKLCCLILIFLAMNVSAEKITYNQWLDQEIKSFSTQDKIFEQDVSSSWSLQKVKLRVRPLIGVEVPYLASLEIKPFVEFHWKAKK